MAGHQSRNREEVYLAVIGAGASGCMAAVSACLARRNLPVRILLLEGNDKIGKKIYATGNGRCNLTNLRMSEDFFHADGGKRIFIRRALEKFGTGDLIRFMQERGIYLHDKGGYVYPRTDQAATIAEAFEKMLGELGAEVKPGDAVVSVSGHGEDGRRNSKDHSGKYSGKYNGNYNKKGRFRIQTASGKTYFAEKVILACGGMAGPQYGCRGDGYKFAAGFGHTVTEPLPGLVQLHSPDPLLTRCAGVRCDARVSLLTKDGKDGSGSASGLHSEKPPAGYQVLDIQRGELQITEHGVSGIPVFQFSAAAGRALHFGKKVLVRADFLPEFTDEQWLGEIERRLSMDRSLMLGTYFLGLVNRKILNFILERRGLQAEKKASKVPESVLRAILSDMRDTYIEIDGTGTFRQAQVTAGGVPVIEIDDCCESGITDGLYLTGELLDVDGICGGYNLQWAMTSGWIAGKAAVMRAPALRTATQKTDIRD